MGRAGEGNSPARLFYFGEELGEGDGDGDGGRERRLGGDAIRATLRCGAARRIFFPGFTARGNLCRASGADFLRCGSHGSQLGREKQVLRCAQKRRRRQRQRKIQKQWQMARLKPVAMGGAGGFMLRRSNAAKHWRG